MEGGRGEVPSPLGARGYEVYEAKLNTLHALRPEASADFNDPLKEIRGFSVVRAFQNGRKLAPKRAKKEENSTRDAKREQIEAKVRAKTRPEPQNRRQHGAKWPRQVLAVSWHPNLVAS